MGAFRPGKGHGMEKFKNKKFQFVVMAAILIVMIMVIFIPRERKGEPKQDAPAFCGVWYPDNSMLYSSLTLNADGTGQSMFGLDGTWAKTGGQIVFTSFAEVEGVPVQKHEYTYDAEKDILVWNAVYDGDDDKLDERNCYFYRDYDEAREQYEEHWKDMIRGVESPRALMLTAWQSPDGKAKFDIGEDRGRFTLEDGTVYEFQCSDQWEFIQDGATLTLWSTINEGTEDEAAVSLTYGEAGFCNLRMKNWIVVTTGFPWEGTNGVWESLLNYIPGAR